ncbi:MAG TPA: STAS domain-containing protein [Thermodesulfobacteriota bacterium]|nr:STAS domain-containing protein [Thermodesulfobacteriota bacterium]
MSLKVTSREREPGVFIVSPAGSLDSNTYAILEKRIDLILEGTPRLVVFDMENLNYISSMGVRVIVKTQKALKGHNGSIVLMNLQPQIKKVFEIINALPSQQVFNSTDELDQYLDRMQRKVTEN